MRTQESVEVKGVASEDAIRKRAYEIWEQCGRPYGREVDHWLQAESEQLNRAQKQAGRKKAHKSRSEPRADHPAHGAVQASRGGS